LLDNHRFSACRRIWAESKKKSFFVGSSHGIFNMDYRVYQNLPFFNALVMGFLNLPQNYRTSFVSGFPGKVVQLPGCSDAVKAMY
jgi:hypothetical protein